MRQFLYSPTYLNTDWKYLLAPVSRPGGSSSASLRFPDDMNLQDIQRNSNKPGRPLVPFKEKIAPLVDPDADDSTKTVARLSQLFGHVLTFRAIKIMHAGDDEVVGLGLDGVTVDGRKVIQCRIRSDHFLQPIVDDPCWVTITLPPLLLKRVTNKQAQAVVAKTKRFQWAHEEKDQFNESRSMSVLVDHLSELFSTIPLCTQRPLLVTMDKGPQERVFFLWLMCSGEKVCVFWDGPHVENMAVIKVAEKALPAQMKRVTGLRGTADKVHSTKLAETLLHISNMDDQLLADCIGENLDKAWAELKCSSEEVLGNFRTACLELIPRLGDMNQERWLSWTYACRLLANYWTTFEIASEINFKIEGGEPDKILMSRVESTLIRDNVRRCEYNREDLDALVELIVHGVKKEKAGTLLGSCVLVARRSISRHCSESTISGIALVIYQRSAFESGKAFAHLFY